MNIDYRDKDLIVFDLDGTLTETKSIIASSMALALRELLKIKKVAVIGGGSYESFQDQLLHHLKCPPKLLENLFLFPTTATAFYRYENKGWKKIYSKKLSERQKMEIRGAFKEVLDQIHYVQPWKVYGKLLDDRGAEMSYSFLGQDVVAVLGRKGVSLKKQWTRENAPLKLKVARMVQRRLPDMEVRAAGFTTIDVTKKGIDKAYGIREIKDILKVPIKRMVFIGDALRPGGNDYAAERTGIDCVPVYGPAETERIIKKILVN
jgi:hypothetical protein